MKYLQKLDIHDLFRRFNTIQLMFNINLTKMYLYSSIVLLTKRLHACKKNAKGHSTGPGQIVIDRTKKKKKNAKVQYVFKDFLFSFIW